MAALRHIAICTKQPRETAEFYERVFGLKIINVVEEDQGTHVFSTDGVVNVAFLNYHTDAAARAMQIPDSDYVGIHHIGFVDADPAARISAARAAGGGVLMEPGSGSGEFYFEYKLLDPNGIVVDVSRGWPGITAPPAAGDEASVD